MNTNLNLYGKLFRYVLFPFYESILRRRKTLTYLKSAENICSKSRQEVEDIQFEKLSKLLAHAYKNVPYYTNLLDQHSIKPCDIKSLADFAKLPILTKDIVKKEYDNLIAINHRGTSMKKSTGGSTGQPFTYEFNYDSHKQREAIAMRGYGLAGIGLGVKTWQLWGQDLVQSSTFKQIKTDLFHRFYNRKIANSFAMTENNIQSYVDDLNHFKPDAIVSYTSPLYQLAIFILENNIKIHQVKAIITGAEPLYEYQRESIERAFNASVHNTYGCREVMLIASEAETKHGLFVNDDHLVVETIDDNDEVIIESTGRIIVTDLSNYAMPLIRYENGDQAIKAAPNNDQPLPFSYLRSIEGRKLDVIKTPDGRLLPGEFFPHLLKDFEGITRFQIVQKSLNILNVLIVKNESYQQESEDMLFAIISKQVGDGVDVNINYVDKIALTKSGKYRVTVSDL